MTVRTADLLRGTVLAAVAGLATAMTHATGLPHGLGYYVAGAAFLVGMRFGLGAVGMLVVCCLAFGVGEVARGGCAAGSDPQACAFRAAAPLLVFYSFALPLLAGVGLAALVRASSGLADSRAARRVAPLDVGPTVTATAVVTVTAAIVAATVPLAQGRSYVVWLAAGLAVALSPSRPRMAAQESPMASIPGGGGAAGIRDGREHAPPDAASHGPAGGSRLQL